MEASVELDEDGKPTGMLYAKTKATAIYMTLGLTTKLSHEKEINSHCNTTGETDRLRLNQRNRCRVRLAKTIPTTMVSLLSCKRREATLYVPPIIYNAQVSGRELQDNREWNEQYQTTRATIIMFLANGYLAEGAGEKSGT
jgi:hypothetical protein